MGGLLNQGGHLHRRERVDLLGAELAHVADSGQLGGGDGGCGRWAQVAQVSAELADVSSGINQVFEVGQSKLAARETLSQ